MAGLKKNGGLGKGLDALLGDFSITEQTTGVQEVDITLLDTNPGQPRKAFDPERLEELKNSILRHGVVQPIVVRKNGSRYTIVTGERRYRASRLAGLKTMPVVVREFDDKQVMEVALIENIQREDLNPIEEAAAIRFLMDQHDLTQEEVSERLSKSRPAIANSLRLLNLPQKVMEQVKNGALSAGHGRVLAGITDADRQQALADKAVAEQLSVRALEELSKAEPKAQKPKKKKEAPAKAELYDLQEQLRERLGAKVAITGSQKKGRIVIEYFDRDVLDTLYQLLNGEN